MNVFGCLIWLSLEKSSQEKVSFSKRFPWAWEQNESSCRIGASSCFSPISSGERDGDSFHYFLSLMWLVLWTYLFKLTALHEPSSLDHFFGLVWQQALIIPGKKAPLWEFPWTLESPSIHRDDIPRRGNYPAAVWKLNALFIGICFIFAGALE